MRRTRTWYVALASLTGACLMLTACAGGDGDGGQAGGSSGELVVETGLTGDKGAAFEAVLAAFEEESGIPVTHVGVQSVQTDLQTRIQAGDPPDVALFPQPGLILDLAAQGDVQPLDDVLDVEQLDSGIVPGLLDASRQDGQTYGVPFSVSVKSIVWYPPAAFADAGYEVPTTWAEFTALVDQIKDDGNTPFCFGIEAGGGTGWPATDWLEEIVLRLHGPDVYDQWVTHEIPFDSPEIEEAMSIFDELLLAEGNTYGGRQTIINTSSQSLEPMFPGDGAPECYLYRQGSFMANALPEDVAVGEDVDIFYLPAMSDTGYEGMPVEGGGDIAAMLVESDDAVELMKFLASPEGGTAWAERGGFLSPWTEFDENIYPDDFTRAQAKMIRDASAFRFDASDLMPASVGTGAFFEQMTAWINGQQETAATLSAIDDAWPAS